MQATNGMKCGHNFLVFMSIYDCPEVGGEKVFEMCACMKFVTVCVIEADCHVMVHALGGSEQAPPGGCISKHAGRKPVKRVLVSSLVSTVFMEITCIGTHSKKNVCLGWSVGGSSLDCQKGKSCPINFEEGD